jgi:hypothetical protein
MVVIVVVMVVVIMLAHGAKIGAKSGQCRGEARAGVSPLRCGQGANIADLLRQGYRLDREGWSLAWVTAEIPSMLRMQDPGWREPPL